MSFLLQRNGRRVLATPALTGTILPGVTRDSVLQLAREWGECDVQERPITIAEVREVGGGVKEGMRVGSVALTCLRSTHFVGG